MQVERLIESHRIFSSDISKKSMESVQSFHRLVVD